MDKRKIEQGVNLIIEGIGEDIKREGLRETPKRVANMCEELLAGMSVDASEIMKKTFEVKNTQVVLEKDISFYSLCEHHMLPFFGSVHIAYMPQKRVIGLSKLARLVEIYARRLQIQERMTNDIAEAIINYSDVESVMVVIEAEHMCMSMRGIKKRGCKTVTIACKGVFDLNMSARQEILNMIKN